MSENWKKTSNLIHDLEQAKLENEIKKLKRKNNSGFYISFGSLTHLIVALISYYFNKSILWLLIHLLLSEIYLLYILFTGKLGNGNIQKIIDYYFG